ncbi:MULTISPECIES: ABC transporter ATP-binding protein [Halorussus]|uniref:ABC transporter ATP-binding protein n=1 Tax=Halorussus TaxID=1070314 RepID=UPI000E21056A|nr:MULTISPECIES: ABC transporter ATP-binding protein [Halorussus]NHN57677.1 ABC transporter ATP-binding protein [Halorussus sp. JP-T4]
MPAIELRSLSKRFGDVVALRGLDLAVEEGEVFGFLGPNGAGKSTTIDIVLDFVRPSGGRAEVFGLDAQAETKQIRRRVGVLPDGYHLDGHLTARHHLEFAIDSKDADDDPRALLDRVGLGDVLDRRVGGFSKGMAQRLLLGMALVGDPDLLILDEPSTGLDPNGARRMREIVLEEADRGATVFFSSHILGQVEAVCDRVGILADGDLVAVDTMEGLQETVGSEATMTVTLDGSPDGRLEAVREVDGVSNVSVDGTAVSLSCPDDRKIDALDALRADGAMVRNIETSDASLDELFAAYTEGRA